MKRQYVIDALILAALVAFSIFLYHSGKGYTLIFDNRNITPERASTRPLVMRARRRQQR